MTTIYTYNGQVLKEVSTGKWLAEKPSIDPLNPLGLPPNTVRIRTSGAPSGYYDSATLVAGTNNIYDVYKSGTNFDTMFVNCTTLVEILGANTSGITSMNYMFYKCTAVESGALTLYQQVSSQSNPPQHIMTFYDCGAGTVTGRAELEQIPSDWK